MSDQQWRLWSRVTFGPLCAVTPLPRDPMKRMLRVGTCSVCATGNPGIRVAASGKIVVAMCDECDAVWLDAHLRDGPYSPEQPDLPCPGEGSSLRSAPAHWASSAEAEVAGWKDNVLGETETSDTWTSSKATCGRGEMVGSDLARDVL
jgi:hypothetical protein